MEPGRREEKEPVHIKAKPEDVAELCLIMGDPARVEHASSVLSERRLVNAHRGFIAYTGMYRGLRVTMACHGVGGPSAAIVVEELAMLGAKRFVRLGTTGAFLEGIEPGDVVVPTAALYRDSVPSLYLGGSVGPTVPDYGLLQAVVRGLEERGIRAHLGPVFSSDAFYLESPSFASEWASRGALAVEMECATIFAVAAVRRLRAAAVLIVSNNLARRTRMLDAEELRPTALAVTKAILDELSRER